MNPTQPLRHHHKHCDELFASAEDLAHQGDWPRCAASAERFRAETEAHFATEEEVLFPAFAAATGMNGGPVAVMRMEHAQMRELMAAMTESAKAQDRNGFIGAAETLLILMQQHNMKEENILYPMCDNSLGAVAPDIAGALDQRVGEACPA
ncbi:MAG TPA: hemerythrin domain-containing protein [Rhodocyclaceae bacterium]